MLVAPMMVAKTRRPLRQRRRRPAQPRRRVYIGSAVSRRNPARFFLRRTAQQMTSGSRMADGLGALAMLGGMASWGMLLALLGS